MKTCAPRHAARQPENHWMQLLYQCIAEFCLTWTMEEIPASQLLDWVFEFGNEQRNSVAGKLTISTVHASKGREFKHVILLDGDWSPKPTSDERRLYYVGMTRARQTLTLFEFSTEANPYSSSIRNRPYALFSELDTCPARDPALDIKFIELGMSDVDMDYASRQYGDAKIHQTITDLRVGDKLSLVEREIQTREGIVIGRLSKSCNLSEHDVISIEVCAIASRYEKLVADSVWRERLKVKSWETVLCLVKVMPS